jgi:DNA-binding beta-propeller fold protein YncE
VKSLQVSILALSGLLAFAQAHLGDKDLATQTEIDSPFAIAVDGYKALYIAVGAGGIKRVDLKNNVIVTLQLRTRLEAINSLTLDSAGNLIACEFTEDRVRKVDPRSGTVSNLAGGHRLAFSGDGGLAIDAGLRSPNFVIADRGNNIYISDAGNYRIRRVDAKTGIISTVAGSGKRDSSGDGGPALAAGLEYPNSIAIDRDGNLFIAQYGYGRGSHRIRRVDAKTGIITTVAGLAEGGISSDGDPALRSSLQSPSHLLFDPAGDLYFLDPINDRVRCIDAKTGAVRLIAGSTKGFSGDGGPANRAQLNNPSAIAIDSRGNLYVADYVNQRIRQIEKRSGIIRTVAGNGLPVRHDVKL